MPQVASGYDRHVSIFGHGTHACPGRHLALSLTRIIIAQLLFTVHLDFLDQTTVEPPVTAVGAVARSSSPILVSFSKSKRKL